MAQKKEAVVVILDVGTTMSSNPYNTNNITSSLEVAVKSINLLVQQKLLFGKNDELALVLFGTEETRNNLSDKGYEHITVLRDMGFPDLDLVKEIEKIEPGNTQADLLDALIVGMDILVRRQAAEPKKTIHKRVFLVTDAGMPINKQDLGLIIDQFNKMEARLNVIGVNFSDQSDESQMDDDAVPKNPTKAQNEKMLHSLCEKVPGIVIPVSQAIEMMSYLRSRSVLQRSSFRGVLEIADKIKIPIWSFVKTMPLKFPTLSKLSAVSQNSAQPGSMGVAIERTYHSVLDPDTEITEEERVKGYKYGKSFVPFSRVDEAVLKYEADSCLKIIGFTSAKNIPRHHFMGNSECMVCDPNDKNAGVALAALIQAMLETDSVGIVRYVKRNRSIPHLGVLYPHVGSEFNCFYYNSLPFAEDLRQFSFAALLGERARKGFVPTEQQKQVVDRLIEELDLMTANHDDEGHPQEALKPKYTYNPTLQRFFQSVQHRALHPKDKLPQLDPVSYKYIHPDEELFHKARNTLQKFGEAFPLSKQEESDAKAARVYWKDSINDQQMIKLDSYVPDPSKKRKMEAAYGPVDVSLEEFLSTGVSEVGSIKPVEDFKEMISRRDVDLVDKAIEGMKRRIIQLVNDSVLNQLYKKALDCLIALRAGCVQEEESDAFNEFLRDLRSMFENKRRDDFWRLIAAQGLTLIHYEESADSSITPSEANEFLSAPVPKYVMANKPKGSEEDAEELFNQLE